MNEFVELWWILPTSVLFLTIAVGSGVSGALFFSPFFMLVVGLVPVQAVGAGLLTEVFGMGNGLRSYVRAGTVDYATARWLLLGAVPSVVVGALLADQLSSAVLKVLFGLGLIVLSGFLVLVRHSEECEPGDRAIPFIEQKSRNLGTTVIKARDGSVHSYKTCWRPPFVGLAAICGLFTGMISAGLPEISTTQLVIRCHLPARVAIATSVFTFAIVALIGAGIHALAAEPPWHVVGWSTPGVLIGSAIGNNVGKHLPGPSMEKGLGVVFGLVGGLVLALEFLR